MNQGTFSLFVGTIFLLSGCGSDGTSSQPIDNPIPVTAPQISDSDKQDYLDAINNARGNAQHCGTEGDFEATTDLTWSDSLYKAAYEHDYDMAESGIINSDHTGSGTQYDHTAQVQMLGEGSTFDQRIKNNGYQGNTPWLENLTVSPDNPKEGSPTDTAQKAVDEWLKSPRHCANLMNPNVKEVGMAYIHKAGGKYTHFWTQDFGAGK